MQSSLAASATKCNELLETLLARVGNEGCRHRSNLELAPIEDQVARFRIWAGNLGAFHKSSSTESLDHRLRDEPKFKDHIYELLQDLNDTLQAGRWWLCF